MLVGRGHSKVMKNYCKVLTVQIPIYNQHFQSKRMDISLSFSVHASGTSTFGEENYWLQVKLITHVIVSQTKTREREEIQRSVLFRKQLCSKSTSTIYNSIVLQYF